MSNIGSKIEKLIADGFSYNTLRGLSESQVNLLFNRLVEQTTTPITMVPRTDTTKINQLKQSKQTFQVYEKELEEEDEVTIDPNKDTETQDPHQVGPSSNDGYNKSYDGMSEGVISEKFESKRQQKYFWWKCNSSKSEKAKKKWCKWAKEFSDDTDFSKLPEKTESQKKLEEGLTKLVEKYIPESITKKQLMDLIESSTKTKEAPPKEKEKTKKKPGNPFKIEPAQKPGPKGEMKENGGAAPAKAPERTKEKEKEKEKPGKKNPFKIEPAQKPGPKGRVPQWLSFDTFTDLGYNLK